jgi:peptidoglycan-associated lipoprotein
MSKTLIKSLFYSLFAVLLLSAKCGQPSFSDANKRYEVKEYAVAADMYAKVSKNPKATKKEKLTSAINAAQAYYYNHDYKNALKWYSLAIQKGAKDPIFYYKMGECLKMTGKYTEAILKFQEYKKMQPDDPNTAIMIEGCESALKWKDEKTRYHVSEFKPANEITGQKIRSDDYSPMWANKRKTALMFTTDRKGGESGAQYNWTGRKYSDLWMIELQGKGPKAKWGEAVIVPGINTDYNDGTCTFDEKGTKMYFTQCNGLKGDELKCKIYEARKSGKEWDITPKPLPFCNDKFNFGHPSLSSDGEKLFFASDMPGGQGDTNTHDIWVSSYVKRGKTWSDPVNLGPTINTKDNEVFPYIFSDGTLYFSSDGHPGIGALDIFYSKGSGLDWEKPINMKSPINSYGDDFGIIMDDTKEKGYFSSNRSAAGKPDDNIYEFYMDKLVFRLSGVVTDCKDGKPLAKSLITISNNHDSTKIRLYTDSKGYYSTEIKVNTKYELFASKREEYYYDSKEEYVTTMGLEQSADFKRDFCLKNQCSDIFILPIYYGLDSANIYTRSESKKVLDDLIATLKKYPKMAIELGTHTDCRSPFDYNRALSQRRADSAVAYIIKSGVNPFRLSAMGYGESRLVNECECEGGKVVPCTEEQHQQNRRAEVKVLDCNFQWTKEVFNRMNDSALAGGPVSSPFLQEERKKYGADKKNRPKDFVEANSAEAKADALAELKEKYDLIPVTILKEKITVSGKIGKKNVKFDYDSEESSTIIPEVVVAQLIASKIITLADFAEGNKSYVLPDGTKIKSKSFDVKEITLGDVKFTNVRCVVGGPAVKKAILGYSLFENYESYKVEGTNILLEKRAK